MRRQSTPLASITCALLVSSLAHGLEPGEQIHLTIRGVQLEEQQKIDGNYRVGESGSVHLPLLEQPIAAKNLSSEQFARAVESAYQKTGIFTRPAIEVETLQGAEQGAQAAVSVSGQVRRGGEIPFRKNLTVLQALDAVGGRNDFGSRNLLLFREGRQYCLDFNNLRHKNILLKPGDSLQVEQKGIVDRWKGSQDGVRSLLQTPSTTKE